MRRSWLVLAITSILGALAGIAIAGRPTTVDDTVILPPSSTTAAPTTTTGVAPTTSSTTAPDDQVDPRAVRVLVANATDRAGIAGGAAVTLTDAGFTAVRAVDAIGSAAVTTVYSRTGFEAAARLVAQELGIPLTSVQPLPGDPITAEDASADVVVEIGDDFSP